jgi:NAD(P)-dependent dehydrogenase (short-subunit alcohol dehydrogenase family)
MTTAGGNHELEGTVAIVTGASSGIGEATAEMLAARGARVVITARSEAKLERLVQAHGDRMIAVAGDASDPATIDRLFTETERHFGPCDLLVNNAGMIDPGPFVDSTLERWERMFAVNVRSVYLTSQRALPSMIERKRGAIVNVASISGVPGPEKFPGWVSYCASKAAVISLTEALAVELKGTGVRVNCISPGSVDTEMWAKASGGAPASMTPAEIAEAILFLASPRSRPMNGQNLDIYSS